MKINQNKTETSDFFNLKLYQEHCMKQI